MHPPPDAARRLASDGALCRPSAALQFKTEMTLLWNVRFFWVVSLLFSSCNFNEGGGS